MFGIVWFCWVVVDLNVLCRSMFTGDDLLDLSQTGFERSHFHMNGTMDMMNPGSRQIYLTFPADSSFREEDVSSYFRFIFCSSL